MMQTVIDFISRIDPAKVPVLAALLREIDYDLEDNPHIALPQLQSLHFAALVILEDDEYGPYLVFESNFDGSLDDYLTELVALAADGLDRVYRCCIDYTMQSPATPEQIMAYLRAHAVKPSAYHVGTPGRTVQRIRQEAALRDGIEGFLDDLVHTSTVTQSAGMLRQRIQHWVRSDKAWEWVALKAPRLTLSQRYMPRIKLALLAGGIWLFWPEALCVALLWISTLRKHETTDDVTLGPPKPNHLQQLGEREDHIIQNHMASITRVKPGRFRRQTIRGVMWAVNMYARFATNGKLSGIPSIHFAHWVLIDHDRRLLFMTNFDGSWENYLDDFIDKAAIGLTAIWSNTVNFPRTWFLVGGGARDGQGFKAAARDKQVPTNVFYSAYPKLTVRNIDNNSSIREEIYTDLDEPATKSWLQRF